MCSFDQLSRILRESIPQENVDREQFSQILRALIGPKLHISVPDGYCVGQGDAAVSDKTLLTGGLATCTAVVITTATHNFLCHVGSQTDTKWLAENIREFLICHGDPIEIGRFNAHGRGLNEFSERISREALQEAGLFDQCKDVSDGITGMHTVGAKSPRTKGARLFNLLGKLKVG